MLERLPADVLPPDVGQYTPKHFFFYGSLMNPVRLQEVLHLSATPVLQPARVKFYKIMLWGQYPSLVEGEEDNYVDGMAYLIETSEQQRMLKHYETNAYGIRGTRITIGEKEVSGRTFICADDDLAELSEGTWLLEEWENGVEEEKASHFRPLID